MAINFLSTVDFNGNQIDGAAIQNLASDPITGVLGQLIFNTSSSLLKVCTTAQAGGSDAVYTSVDSGAGVQSLTLASGTNPLLLTGTAADPIIGIGQASASANGYLSSTDWSTFDGKSGTVGTVTSVSGGTGISVSGSASVTPTVNVDYSGADNFILAATDGSSVSVASTDKLVISDDSDNDVKFVNISQITAAIGGGTVTDFSASFAGTAFTATVTDSSTTPDLAITANGASTDYVNGVGNFVALSTIPGTSDTLYTLGKAAASADIVLNANGTAQDSIQFKGTTNEISIDISTADEYVIGMPDDVTIGKDLTVSGSLSVSSAATVDQLVVTQKGTSAATAGSDSSTTLTTKGYVEGLLTGQLVYAGGYDASANPPTGAAILQGFTYVVTVAGSGAGGTYWTTPLAIGDLIIALQDDPSTEANWTEVNKNVTEATLTTIGEGNVNAGEGIDVSYSNGTATVSGENSSASNKGIVIVDGGTGITVNYNAGTAEIVADNNGTVTSVSAGVGLALSGTGSVAPTISAEYTGASNIVLDAPSTATGTLSGSDSILVSSDSTGNVFDSSISNLPFTNNQGDITGVTVTAPITGGGTSGSVGIGIDNASLTAIGASRVAAGTGIGVSVSNGVFTVTNNDPGSSASSGKRYSLGASSGAVTKNAAAGGAQSWTIDTSTDLGKSDAKDVMAQVIQSTGGATVYADVTRSSDELTISFTGAPANDVYEVILTGI